MRQFECGQQENIFPLSFIYPVGEVLWKGIHSIVSIKLGNTASLNLFKKILLCNCIQHGLLNKKTQCFYLPGGKVDAAETAKQALCRKIEEELNVRN